MIETGQRKRVGLALSGGAARGMAHVGVIAVLERAGIPIDFVAGTSAGSLIGACLAAGLSAARITRAGAPNELAQDRSG